jgi:cob(I)alamin adenosyltransferase
VFEALSNRPADQHVIVTGRNANDKLIAMADTVSEINDVKHAFNAGIRVQKGIDY